MQELARILFTLSMGLLILFLLTGVSGELRAMLMGFGLLRARRRKVPVCEDANTILKSPLVPGVALLAVPPDASPASIDFVRSLVGMHSSDHEVLAILDGPTEEDLAVWLTAFRLFPSSRSASGDIPAKAVRAVYESHDPVRLMVVEKEAGGEADCLNVGLNLSGAPLVAVADPGARFDQAILLCLIRPFLERPDATVAAIAMTPAAGAGAMPECFQALASIRAWLGRGAGLASRGAALPAAGAFMLFDRQALRDANGFDSSPFEMIFHLHALFRARKKDYRIEWVDRSLAAPHPVRSFEALRKSEEADQRRIRRTLVRHWPVMGSFGALGRFAVPGLVFTRLFRPAAETLGYVLCTAGLALRLTSWQLPMLFLLASCVFGMLNSMLAVLLREAAVEAGLTGGQLVRLLAAAIPENLGYRQVRNVRLLLSWIR